MPIVTMRLFAEERKAGTLELLLTAPVRESQLVLAKYLAAMAIVLTMIALTGAYAVVLGIFGTPEWGPIYSGYLGLALLSSTLVALGLLISALTSNQIVAAVVTIGISFMLWMIDSLAAMMPEGLRARSDQPVVAGALYAVRDRCHAYVRFRLLRVQHAAGVVPGHARARAAVTKCLPSPLTIHRPPITAFEMEHGPIEWGALAWFSGWLVAVAVLFFAGLQLPLQTRLARGRSLLYNGIVVAAALAIAALACTASILHDLHLDLTREKIYTPSSQAMAVVDRLERPVQLTYFYPDGMLQYVAVEGRRELYLLSRFVGQEWDAAAKGALGG